MPSKIRLRYIFRPFIKSMAKNLSKLGVTANIATTIMLVFALLSFALLVLFNNPLFFGIAIFLVGIFDGIDGAIARITNTTSKKGTFLDSTMDRFSEFIIFLAILIYCWDQLLWNTINMNLVVFISSFTSIMISYIRARAENEFMGDFDFGLMARSERLFYLVITSIIDFFFGFFNELLFIFMWLVVGTALYRYAKIKEHIKEKERKTVETKF